MKRTLTIEFMVKKEKKEGNFIKFAHEKLLPVLCRKKERKKKKREYITDYTVIPILNKNNKWI